MPCLAPHGKPGHDPPPAIVPGGAYGEDGQRAMPATMIPIHRLLARLRWDPQFGSGHIVVTYLDKLAGTMCSVALQELRPDADNPSLLDLIDRDGTVHSIPLHRIRQVSRDGEIIWQRRVAADPPPH